MRVLLVGNYGAGNVGDELLRTAFESLPGISWTVVSARPAPGDVPRLPGGLRSLLSLRWRRTIQEMRRSDAVVFGGGTLLADYESWQACFLWWLHARVARLFDVPVLFAAQGIGPLRTRLGTWFARDALHCAMFISVRDALSAERVKDWGLTTKIVQTFDPAFALLHAENHMDRSDNVLIVFPRLQSGDALRDAVSGALEKDRYEGVVLGLMQPDSREEQAVAERFQAEFPGAAVRTLRTLQDLQDLLRHGRHVISQRYHGSIAALACGKRVETVSQVALDKHASLPSGPLTTEERARFLTRIKDGERALLEALGSIPVRR